MKRRPVRENKYTAPKSIGEAQVKFLREVIKQKCKLSKRESYVVDAVLVSRTYHENHSYHLNKLREKYGYIMKKVNKN